VIRGGAAPRPLHNERVARSPTRLRRALDRLRGRPVDYELAKERRLLAAIAEKEPELRALEETALAARARSLREGATRPEGPPEAVVVEAFALAREAACRVLGQRAFDEQVLAGLAMQRGRVVELATGEGKTLAAVAPAFVAALDGRGVHVLTFNDYLARRDAEWMGPVYRRLGLRVGFVQEGQDSEERRSAYGADVTYATAKECGFDHLRDGLVLSPRDRVHRPLHAALVDEADSILVDEARVPLVIAGDTGERVPGPERSAAVARRLRPGVDFDTDEHGHNIALTEAGTARVEGLLGCGPLFSPENLVLHAQVRNALHALHLLSRDVDYIVRRGKVELVDDFTGRVADRRRWPDGLQAALEAKEGLRPQPEGKVLGQITLQHFLRLYPRLMGMTATAEEAAEELVEFYDLAVSLVPTHRPMIRVDEDDVVFTHEEAKRRALVGEIAGVHETGRPVLVGTASVAESESLAAALVAAAVPCSVLNARDDEREAQVVARAGAPGAVTISTNMAGRGTDIRLGGPDEAGREAVVSRGGLYVIGTSRHESRRVDQQLRGRAGRQGDPGRSRFFVSLEDELVVRYGVERLLTARHLPPRQDGPVASPLVAVEIARAQRIVEGESLEVRRTLFAYAEAVEVQRRAIADRRLAVLQGEPDADSLLDECAARLGRHPGLDPAARAEAARHLLLLTLDRCWSDHLGHLAELRDDSHLLAFGGKYPLAEFQRAAGEAFPALVDRIEEEALRAADAVVVRDGRVDWEASSLLGPSATWTYLVGENPFGAGGWLSPTHRPLLAFAAAALWPLLVLQGAAVLWKRLRGRLAARR
jgi:preprotein translocase subunit SecA